MACANKLLRVVNDGYGPSKGTKYSAAVDLYASEDVIFKVASTHIVGLGVAICPEQINKLAPDIREQFLLTHYLALYPRSGLRAKGFIANKGIIDMDYPKEIKIILKYFPNDPTKHEFYSIKKGDRIAQIMLMRHETGLLNIHTEEERTDGFGSTDAVKAV